MLCTRCRAHKWEEERKRKAIRKVVEGLRGGRLEGTRVVLMGFGRELWGVVGRAMGVEGVWSVPEFGRGGVGWRRRGSWKVISSNERP